MVALQVQKILRLIEFVHRCVDVDSALAGELDVLEPDNEVVPGPTGTGAAFLSPSA